MKQLWTAIRQRSALYRGIRQYFDQAGFLEVETPVLSLSPIPEKTIELFETLLSEVGKPSRRIYLAQSPELYMKALLANGSPSLYQISKCFRNNEQLDRWHRWEFSMLEWYEVGVDAIGNIDRTQRLLTAICEALDGVLDDAIVADFRVMTMNQAFEEFAGFSLENDLGSDDSEHIRHALIQRLIDNNLPIGNGQESLDDLFHRLFLSLVEHRLPTEKPLILKDWPAIVPTLAKRIQGSPWAERWEMYYHGVEVANCYTEENNLDALKEYWRGQHPKDDDERWIHAIADGMPHCSGVAMGLDRLLALIRGDTSLEGLDLFPPCDMILR